MKKRAMKKWIPKGMYCYSGEHKCKWRKYYKTIKLDKSNCKNAYDCDEICWSKPENSCKIIIYGCKYMNYIDYAGESFLWDQCKECGVKDF